MYIRHVLNMYLCFDERNVQKSIVLNDLERINRIYNYMVTKMSSLRRNVRLVLVISKAHI